MKKLIWIMLLAACAVSACGGGSSGGSSDTTPPPPPPSFTVGGTVANLILGTSIVLEDNGGDSLTIQASSGGSSTAFTFTTELSSGAAYAVTIAEQPLGQTCIVGQGSGVVATTDVTTPFVDCTPNKYTVGGTVTGLNQKLVIGDGFDNQLTLSAGSTSFVFTPGVESADQFTVSIENPLSGQMCTVANGSGTIVASNVTDVAITCVTTGIGIGGTVSGLTGTNSVVLQDNGGDNLQVFANGWFLFATALSTGATYHVTVLTQPPNQTCAVTAGGGTTGSTIVTDVIVACTTNTYTVGGTLTGLPSGETLVLTNAGGDPLTITSSGSFTFSTPVASGGGYAVFTQTVPAGMTCGVSGGLGTIVTSDITNVLVQCEPNAGSTTYTVGGTISGLSAAGLVLLDAGFDTLTVAANSISFTFDTGLITGTPYGVTIQTQPAGEICTVTNGTGTIASANVSNVSLTCVVGMVSARPRIAALVSPPPVVVSDAVFSTARGDAAGLATLLRPGASALVGAQIFEHSHIAGLALVDLISPQSAGWPGTLMSCSEGGAVTRTLSLSHPDTGAQNGNVAVLGFDRCSNDVGLRFQGKVSVALTSEVAPNQFALEVATEDLSVTREGVTYGPYKMRGSISQGRLGEAARFSIDVSTVEVAPIVTTQGPLATIRSGSIYTPYGTGIANIRYTDWNYDMTTGVTLGGTAQITGARGNLAVVTVTPQGYAVTIMVAGVNRQYLLPQ